MAARLNQQAADQLAQMIAGARITQVLAVTAELGLADLLQDGPRSPADLARASDTHAPSLTRLLRTLSSLGIVQPVGDRYQLTELGEALRSDRPERLDLRARYMGGDARWRPWGHLRHSIQTGEAAFPEVFGMPAWDYDEQHPETGRLFNELMSAGSRQRQDAILAAYDFSRFGTVVDVGGGHGQLLGALLQQHPGMRGILFDQPHVLAGAPETLDALGVMHRCTLVAGSFFETAPPPADAFILKFILHDWDDEQALAILRRLSHAAAPGTALLVIDRVLPDDRPPDVADALMDLHMLVQLGGKERTAGEFDALFQEAGFQLTRIVPTASDVSIVEGTRTS